MKKTFRLALFASIFSLSLLPLSGCFGTPYNDADYQVDKATWDSVFNFTNATIEVYDGAQTKMHINGNKVLIEQGYTETYFEKDGNLHYKYTYNSGSQAWGKQEISQTEYAQYTLADLKTAFNYDNFEYITGKQGFGVAAGPKYSCYAQENFTFLGQTYDGAYVHFDQQEFQQIYLFEDATDSINAITIRIHSLEQTVTLPTVESGGDNYEVNATQWNNAMHATKFSYEYTSNSNAPNQTVYVDNNKMKVIYEDQTVEYMSTEADVVYTYEINGSQWEKRELAFTTFDQITGKFILLSLDFDDFTFNDEYYHAENVLITGQGTYDVVNVAFNNGVLDYIYLEVDNNFIEMSFLSSNYFTIILPQVDNGGNGNNAQGVSVTKNDWESTLWQTKYAINYVMENMEVLAMVDGNKAKLIANNNEQYFELDGNNTYAYISDGTNWTKTTSGMSYASLTYQGVFDLLEFDDFVYNAASGSYSAENVDLSPIFNVPLDTEVIFSSAAAVDKVIFSAGNESVTIEFRYISFSVVLPTIAPPSNGPLYAVEWENAFNLNKFSYTIKSNQENMPSVPLTMFVDGNKARCVDTEERYYSVENDTDYIYQLSNLTWTREEGFPFEYATGKMILSIFDYDDFSYENDYYFAKNLYVEENAQTFDLVKIGFDGTKLDYIHAEIDGIYSRYIFGGTDFTVTLPNLTSTPPGSSGQLSQTEFENALDVSKYSMSVASNVMDTMYLFVDGDKARQHSDTVRYLEKTNDGEFGYQYHSVKKQWEKLTLSAGQFDTLTGRVILNACQFSDFSYEAGEYIARNLSIGNDTFDIVKITFDGNEIYALYYKSGSTEVNIIFGTKDFDVTIPTAEIVPTGETAASAIDYSRVFRTADYVYTMTDADDNVTRVEVNGVNIKVDNGKEIWYYTSDNTGGYKIYFNTKYDSWRRVQVVDEHKKYDILTYFITNVKAADALFENGAYTLTTDISDVSTTFLAVIQNQQAVYVSLLDNKNYYVYDISYPTVSVTLPNYQAPEPSVTSSEWNAAFSQSKYAFSMNIYYPGFNETTTRYVDIANQKARVIDWKDESTYFEVRNNTTYQILHNSNDDTWYANLEGSTFVSKLGVDVIMGCLNQMSEFTLSGAYYTAEDLMIPGFNNTLDTIRIKFEDSVLTEMFYTQGIYEVTITTLGDEFEIDVPAYSFT